MRFLFALHITTVVLITAKLGDLIFWPWYGVLIPSIIAVAGSCLYGIWAGIRYKNMGPRKAMAKVMEDVEEEVEKIIDP